MVLVTIGRQTFDAKNGPALKVWPAIGLRIYALISLHHTQCTFLGSVSTAQVLVQVQCTVSGA